MTEVSEQTAKGKKKSVRAVGDGAAAVGFDDSLKTRTIRGVEDFFRPPWSTPALQEQRAVPRSRSGGHSGGKSRRRGTSSSGGSLTGTASSFDASRPLHGRGRGTNASLSLYLRFRSLSPSRARALALALAQVPRSKTLSFPRYTHQSVAP